MQSSSKHIKLAIGAIQLEIDGRDFFLKAVEMSHNKLGKKMFQKLADDERRHLTDFKNNRRHYRLYQLRCQSSYLHDYPTPSLRAPHRILRRNVK